MAYQLQVEAPPPTKYSDVYENEVFADDSDDRSVTDEDEKSPGVHMVYTLRGQEAVKPAQEPKPSGGPSAAHHEKIMQHLNDKSRNTIHVHPRTLPDRPVPQTVGRRGTTNNDSLSTFLRNHRAAVIGGAIVRDISLLVGDEAPNNEEGQAKFKFADLPVVPLQVPESSDMRPQLLSSSDPSFLGLNSKHLLVFPEEYIAPPGFERVETLPSEALDSLKNAVSERPHDVDKTFLDGYTVSGDIVDFWGIEGLTAKLYKHKSVDNSDQGAIPLTASTQRQERPATYSATEKVILNPKSLALNGTPLAYLFPFIDNPNFKILPITNLELTYSTDTGNPLHKSGLRLEVDLELKGNLQWVGDAIKTLFGSDHPPTIHLSALLSETRNWSKHPDQIDELVLQGLFKDMDFKPWDMFDFKTMGIELTMVKSGGSWHIGFGFIGEVMIINIPEARVPVKLDYRLARNAKNEEGGEGSGVTRTWSLDVIVEDWNNVFGFENINMPKAVLSASFAERDFTSSIRLDISGLIKLNDATFKIHGQFAKGWQHTITWTWIQYYSQMDVPLPIEDHFIEASIGNFSFSDIKKLHAQITGHGVSELQDGDDQALSQSIGFKNVAIRASCTKYLGGKQDRKALELLGEVTVGDLTSYSASLTFATEGITIIGGVKDVDFPGMDSVVIKSAGLKVFVALKKRETSNGTRRSKKIGGRSEKSSVARGGGSGRETSLSVLGVVKYEEVIFKVGLHFDQKEGGGWLAFGSAGHFRLRDIFPSIAEDSFLNLQLENVAIIASSEERGKTKQESQRRQAGDDGGEEGEDSDYASWDVLSEIESYGYPISKGFTICATISSFQQLEQLNDKKKIDGLMLYLTVSPHGDVDVGLTLPKSFRVDLSKYAFLDNFGASIGVEEGIPELKLSATLTLLMEHSDPIVVHGLIIGNMKGAAGELSMDANSRWINPFGLNDALILSDLGIGAGFDYATVLEMGPTRFSLKGRIDIDEVYGSLNVNLDVTKAAGVLKIEISKLDIGEIADVASTLIQDTTLKTKLLGPASAQATALKPGEIVFSDLKLYLSSGAKFLGKYYERGIQVRGKVNFFDKEGDFDGTFNEDGVLIKGGLDAFEIGGLEVTSLQEYEGRKRATVDIEVTKTKQRVFVDGILRYGDVVLKVFVDVDVQRRYLKADIEIKLTESLLFMLKADVEVGEAGLEGLVWSFEGKLKAEIVKAIGEGIIQGINALEEHAKDAINDAEEGITNRLSVLHAALEQMKGELDELRLESRKEVATRRSEIEEQNTVLSQAYDEIDTLEAQYREVKSRKDSKDAEIEEQMRKIAQARAELADKKREMRREYDVKIQEQKDNQAHWIAERERLKQKKEASWGDDLRKFDGVISSWKWWSAVEKERYEWKQKCEQNLADCGLLEKAYWLSKLTEAALGLEEAHADKAVDAAVRVTGYAITNSPEFRVVEQGINNATFEIGRFGQAMEGLVSKGPMGYIEVMIHDEREDLQRQIVLRDSLIADSKKLEEELEAAESALDEGRDRLDPEQEEARKRIAQLEAEIRLKPFEETYRHKKRNYDAINAQADTLLETLDDVRRGMKVDADIVRRVTKLVMEGMPEIKDIEVKASSDMLARHEPLTFDITVDWMKQEHVCQVKWSPGEGAHLLYREAAKKLTALA